MDNFRFSCPTELVFGENSVDNLKELIEGKYKKILLHYGGGSIKKSGLYDRVMDILKSIDCKVFELGGGSVIDSAKAIGIGHFYNGDVWDFFTGNAEVKNSLPLGVILTIPATGSEASMGSVITKEKGLYKRSVNNPMMRPIFAIMDPEITMTLDSRLTFTGIMDIMSHIFERYFTKTENVDLIDSLSEATMKNIIKNSYKLKENLDDYNARAEIMLAGTLAHNGLLGMGRVDDWASHNIAHEISALYGTTHGTTLGIIFPAWMKYVYREEPNRFERFARNVFGVEKKDKTQEEIIHQGISAFENFLRDINVSTRFSEEGLPTDKFEEMAKKATERGPLGSFKSLEQEDIEKIYKLAK